MSIGDRRSVSDKVIAMWCEPNSNAAAAGDQRSSQESQTAQQNQTPAQVQINQNFGFGGPYSSMPGMAAPNNSEWGRPQARADRWAFDDSQVPVYEESAPLQIDESRPSPDRVLDQVRGLGLIDVQEVTDFDEDESSKGPNVLSKYLPTKKHKAAAISIAALLTTTILVNKNDSARNIASGFPLVGSHFNSADAQQAFNVNPGSEVRNSELNEALKLALTEVDAKPIAKNNIGSPENVEDSSAGTAFSQPVELTTELGVLSGDAVSLKIINPEVTWQIKIEDPKFKLIYTGESVDNERVAVLGVDPSSVTIFPMITPSASAWNTVSSDVIGAELKKLNPAITDEQLAALKVKANEDLAAATVPVANIAQQNVVIEMTNDQVMMDGLNSAFARYIGEKLKGSDDLKKIDLSGIKFQLGTSKELPDEARLRISPEKIRQDYSDAVAASQSPGLPPSVKVTSVINGLNFEKPDDFNANQGE